MHECKRSLGRPRHAWGDNIKQVLEDTEHELKSRGSGQEPAVNVANTVMGFCVQEDKEFLGKLGDYQDLKQGCFMELVS
jgi:hypothetical protein